MPSKSKSQQRFFGMVDAYKKGEMKNASSKIKKAAKGMSMSDVKDFAETKHKGLPEKVEEGKVILRMTESEFKKMVNESVNKILTELDWKTYMNAARKRKLQADNLRGQFPRTHLAHGRNSLDDKSDELEKAAQTSFQKKHGKDGYPYQWEGSPDYKGRFTRGNTYSDSDFNTKATTKQGWWRGEKADGIRHYRRGEGFPMRNSGKIHDDQYDYAYGGDDDAWSGDFNGHRTDIVDGNGIKFEPELSQNADYMSDYQDKDYMDALDNMANDMHDYYSGKSKYTKGKGWE